jgi:hypothetical protein
MIIMNKKSKFIVESQRRRMKNHKKLMLDIVNINIFDYNSTLRNS